MVLRRWDTGALTALDREFGLAAGSLAGAAFAPGRLLPAITGQVTDLEWRDNNAAADLAAACGSAGQARRLERGLPAARPPG